MVVEIKKSWVSSEWWWILRSCGVVVSGDGDREVFGK